jgi:hypothetical protein
MSAPKAEAAGLTVERREELRRVAEAAGESNEGGWLVARGLREAVSRGGEVLERAEAAHIETFGPERVLALLDALAAAEAIRDEARAAVERVRALADEWYAALDDGCPSCGPVGFSACDHAEGFHHARSKLRAALDTASSEGA